MDMKRYFDYLTSLRDSGEINMYGAMPYLQKRFPELNGDEQLALKVLSAWMDSFREVQNG